MSTYPAPHHQPEALVQWTTYTTLCGSPQVRITVNHICLELILPLKIVLICARHKKGVNHIMNRCTTEDHLWVSRRSFMNHQWPMDSSSGKHCFPSLENYSSGFLCVEVGKPSVSREVMFLWRRYSWITLCPQNIKSGENLLPNSAELLLGQTSVGKVWGLGVWKLKESVQNFAHERETCFLLFKCGLLTASQVSFCKAIS